MLSGGAGPEFVGESSVALGALSLPPVSLAFDSLPNNLFETLMVEPDAARSRAGPR
jgi:hypothetical protein